MIGRLSGVIAEKTPPQVVIDVAGVGYEVDVPMSTFFNLGALGERAVLLTHLTVREDAHQLFGFLTHEERATFRQLIKISGVGPKMALGLLSGLSVAELAQAVSQQEIGRLTKVPGIGKKTAERMVVELRDRVDATGVRLPASSGVAAPVDPVGEATVALQQLGYKPPEATRLVSKVAAEGDTAEAIIRKALRAALGS